MSIQKTSLITLASLSLLTGCFWRHDYKADCARWYASGRDVQDKFDKDFPLILNESDIDRFVRERNRMIESGTQDKLDQIDSAYKEQLKTADVKAFCEQYINISR
jgi:hypothetical protein